MWFKINFCLLVALIRIHLVQTAACGAITIGVDPNNPGPTGTSTDAFLMTSGGYMITCCGFITGWDLDIDTSTITLPTNLDLQVFRSSGNIYELIGINTVTISSTGADQTFTIPVANRIAVRDQDAIGWNKAVIASGNGGGGGDTNNNRVHSDQTMVIGDTVDATSTTTTNQRYGLRYTLSGGGNPVCSDNATTINNTTPAGFLTTIEASDPDSSDTVNVTQQTVDTRFSINSDTGVVTLNELISQGGDITLDYEVMDLCGNIGTCTLTVTVVNPPPDFSPNSTFISEDILTEIEIFNLANVDPRDPNLDCSLVDPTLPFDIKTIYAADGDKVFSVRTQSAAASSRIYNYDSQDTYEVWISCTDGETTVNQLFYVYLIENGRPDITNLDGSVVINSTHTVSTIVFLVQASDNENDTVWFNITCDPAPAPVIINADGSIYLTADQTNTTISSYNCNVTASDFRGVSVPKALTIIIGDVNQPVTLAVSPNSVTINENSGAGVAVYTFVAIDNNANEQLTWIVESTPGSALFNVTNGTLTVVDDVNYESLASKCFDVSVTVSDSLTAAQKSMNVCFADVNEPPAFGQAAYGIAANESMQGTVLPQTFTWNINDPDVSDSYTLFLNCSPYDEYFALDASERVYLQKDYIIEGTNLASDVECTVTVTDAEGQSAVTTLYISFTEVNQYTPTFPLTEYSFYVPYYSAVGYSPGSMAATDDDNGKFGTVYYTTTQVTTLGSEPFEIQLDGTFAVAIIPSSTNSGLNYSQTYTFQATAYDIGGRSQIVNVTVAIGGPSTVAPTTTTIRYKKFFEIPVNVAWFCLLMVLLFCTAVLAIWVCCTCRGEQGCGPFLRKLRRCCKRNREFKVHRPQPYQGDPDSVRKPPPMRHNWEPHNPPEHPMRVALVRVKHRLVPSYAPTVAPTQL